MEIYLDNNATTRLREIHYDLFHQLIRLPLGNPASPHSWGDRAARLLSESREKVGAFFQAEPEHFYFTSGGSESNTQILRSFAKMHQGKVRYITSPVEHSSVLNCLKVLEIEGHDVVTIPVDTNGLVNQSQFQELLKKDTHLPTLASIQWVNNETGIIQDIQSLSSFAKNEGAFFHTDAAQAVGKLPLGTNLSGIDFLSFTGHKLHAPSGVGVVYARRPNTLLPLIGGGGQESGLRPGTPNLIGIVLLGAALHDRFTHWEEHTKKLRLLRDRFEQKVTGLTELCKINGKNAPRVNNTTNLQFIGVDGRALVARLDQEGVICSQHSACTSQIPEPSYVLSSMGLNEDEAWGSIRFSMSVDNTELEIDTAAKIVAAQAKKLQEWGSMMNFL